MNYIIVLLWTQLSRVFCIGLVSLCWLPRCKQIKVFWCKEPQEYVCVHVHIWNFKQRIQGLGLEASWESGPLIFSSFSQLSPVCSGRAGQPGEKGRRWLSSFLWWLPACHAGVRAWAVWTEAWGFLVGRPQPTLRPLGPCPLESCQLAPGLCGRQAGTRDAHIQGGLCFGKLGEQFLASTRSCSRLQPTLGRVPLL